MDDTTPAKQDCSVLTQNNNNNNTIQTLSSYHQQQHNNELLKCEVSSLSIASSSTSSSTDNLRICLVGTVVDDKATIIAAQKYNLPIITSETGEEIIFENNWTTYFILNEFDGPIFNAIHKSKHKIMGPPALQQAVLMHENLSNCKRPIYNYSMRGVITCITGIHKKDELIKLVNLIHAMGGSIRKDMNSKVTHLICNSSGGEKYQYAMTFRLSVVRAAWVYEAWNNRDNINFVATHEEYTKNYALKAFEGHRICFFGFANDEHQHMVDVLQSNGGIPTDLEDPECSHVVMSNTGVHFPDHIIPSLSNSSSSTDDNEDNHNDNEKEINAAIDETSKTLIIQSRLNDIEMRIKRESAINEMKNDDELLQCSHYYPMDKIKEEESIETISVATGIVCNDEINETSKNLDEKSIENKLDGIVLTLDDANEFLNPNNLSPILKSKTIDDDLFTNHDLLDKIEEEEDAFEFTDAIKRKRDSFDDMSLVSIDSLAPINSAKKQKLLRTGSITRKLRRSMSFVASKTPLSGIMRSRRNSVDPNASINSITSIESTFNESIKKPMKEKFRCIKERITRSSKRDIVNITPKTTKLMLTPNLSNFKRKFYKKTTINENGDEDVDDCDESISQFPQTPEFRKINENLNGGGGAESESLNLTPVSGFKTPLAPKSSNILPRHQQHQFNGNKPSPLITSTTIVTTTTTTTTTSTTTTSSTMTITEQLLDTPIMIRKKSLAVVAALASTAVTTSHAVTISTDVIDNENSICPLADTILTVVDEHTVQTKPELKNNKTHIVKADWFWYTIQNGFADEMDYLFGDYLDSIANTPGGDRRDSLPISFNKRKRKRLSQRTPADGGTPIGTGKRRSSISDAGLLSVSGSFLDCTSSSDKHESGCKHIPVEANIPQEQQNAKNKSMRFNHFMDFFHTESNYVGILDTIVTLFKDPLEKMSDSNIDDTLLNKSEVKAIFSNFLPIHQVHKEMLNCLKELQTNWSEECLIGQIILDNRNDFIKAYPPYINYFEQMKETLIQCDIQKPRFHAFLKINQAKPECGRQSLQDLMIRPVQRLPSISLLLNDILKHTAKSNPDYKKLDDALKAIKEVMTHINEDKRKTEGQKAIFDIFNDIDKCPPHLVSSHRSFILKCEVTELSDQLSGRGDNLMLFLFSDTLEVCKKRSRAFNNGKSPNGLNTTTASRIITTTSSSTTNATSKSYKHIKLMSLSSIRFVIDIRDSQRAFALNCRFNTENKDKLYSFNISDDDIDKTIYLKSLCKQLAENSCRTDSEKFLFSVESHELDIDISDVNIGTLSKAFKFATRTRLKVGRAFSFNKTPSKLKRAVSTMMTSPFGSTNSLTPSTQLAQMKLASCTNINEVGEDDDNESGTSSEVVLVAPMSVQPTRKVKTSTISMASLRRM